MADSTMKPASAVRIGTRARPLLAGADELVDRFDTEFVRRRACLGSRCCRGAARPAASSRTAAQHATRFIGNKQHVDTTAKIAGLDVFAGYTHVLELERVQHPARHARQAQLEVDPDRECIKIQ